VLVDASRMEARAVASLGGPPGAVADVARLLDAVRVRLGLGALPPMPEPSGDLPPVVGSEIDDPRPTALRRFLSFVRRARQARSPGG
jgi:hypothetical protein